MKAQAIALCRVSTPEQKLSNSLNRQEQNVLKAAQALDVEIVKWWSGDVSSKAGTNTKRKDLKEMLEFCKHNKRIKYLIVDEPDRFMRSIDEAFHFEVEFRILGTTVWYASDSNLNKGDLMAKMLKFSKLLPAEGSNEERQRKSINGHVAAIKQGRYTFPPKPGYVNGRLPGVHTRHPVTFIPLQEAFKGVASGLYTPHEALKKLKTTQFSNHYARWNMDKFRHFGADPYYAGILEMNVQVVARNEKGLHEAMISREEHERLKEILQGDYKPRGKSPHYNPEFPMNKILKCSDCGAKLTGSTKNNGRHRADGVLRKKVSYYHKYSCRGCKKQYHRSDVHGNISKHFDKFEYDDSQQAEFTKALEAVWRQRQADTLNEVRRLQRELDKQSDIKLNLVVELSTASDDYKDDIRGVLDKVKLKIKNLTEEIERANNIDEDLVDFIDFGLKYGEELKEDWWDLGAEDRLMCQQLFFPGGITINSSLKVGTHNMSSIYRLAANKKDLSFSEKSLMVELASTALASVS